MKTNVPASRERLDMPSCTAEHGDSFCRSPVDAASAGEAITAGEV